MRSIPEFLSYDTSEIAARYKSETSEYWQTKGAAMAYDLFCEMYRRVPAYKMFLKSRGIHPKKISSPADLDLLPEMDKKNYIDAYDISQRCWDGKIDRSYMLSASSGSTGTAYFWPRSTEQTARGALISQLLYTELFDMHKNSTLYIIAFGMGTWIAGTYMMMVTNLIAQKGYPVTVVTPGIVKDEILRLLEFGQKHYKQIIVVGYPPFLKDVVDYAKKNHISFGDMNVKFLFSGEAFTERWRDHMSDMTGVSNQLRDMINIYGSADVGLIAHETPLTTCIRKLSARRKRLCKALFQSERVPSVVQYDPSLRYFEINDANQLLVSVRSGVPLLRYNTKDEGGLLSYQDIQNALRQDQTTIHKELEKSGITSKPWKLPVLYLFGRGRFTTTLYGVMIYPEFVKYVLDSTQLQHICTGKFTSESIFDEKHDQKLQIRVELSEDTKMTDVQRRDIQKTFVKKLSEVSSEYAHLAKKIGKRATPHVILHSYGDPEYFPRGVLKKTS